MSGLEIVIALAVGIILLAAIIGGMVNRSSKKSRRVDIDDFLG